MSYQVLENTELRKKMMGCWLGKAVGGTLGMPFEGVRDTLNLHYYEPVPTEMLPNDDLDLQVIYAFLLDKKDAPHVDRNLLSAAWQHVENPTDEYGIAKRNLRLGLRPEATGSYDNPFARGMGAAIRTELWACLAPGDPALAVQYAYEDACMDHVGEGVYEAQFIAALQSMAFVEQDREVLVQRAMAFIPEESELRRALSDTILFCRGPEIGVMSSNGWRCVISVTTSPMLSSTWPIFFWAGWPEKISGKRSVSP